jgi:hypothetical protein
VFHFLHLVVQLLLPVAPMMEAPQLLAGEYLVTSDQMVTPMVQLAELLEFRWVI